MIARNGAIGDGQMAVGRIVASLWNDIHTRQSENRGRGEEVSVIGINLGKSMLCGSGQVEGIGSANELVDGGVCESGFDAVENGVGNGE